MKNDQVRVPRDVETCINKKRIVRLVLFAFIEIALVMILVFFGDDIFSGAHPIVSYILFGVLMIVPVFAFDIRFWIFDKTWAGEIISKSDEEYTDYDRSKSLNARFQNNRLQKLQIRLDSGKKIEHTIYDNRSRYAFRHTTYNIGDRVIHVGGTRYIQAVAVGDNDTLICVICGAESRADMPVCQVCGKTLKID